MGWVWEGRTVNSLRLEGGNGGAREQNKVVNVLVERHKHSLSPATFTVQANITKGISSQRSELPFENMQYHISISKIAF